MKYDEDADQYLVEVQVRNTGSVPGKCAVLVYAQTPYGTYEQTNEVEKSAIQFVGYEKSALLGPDETETVLVPVDRYLLASYDQNQAKGYILSAGDYYFAVGESAHDALNNILAVQGYTGMFDQDGTEDSSLNSSCVYQFRDGVPASGDPDSESYAYSKATGERVTNRLRNRISITGRRIPELRSLISAVLTGQRLSPPKQSVCRWLERRCRQNCRVKCTRRQRMHLLQQKCIREKLIMDIPLP